MNKRTWTGLLLVAVISTASLCIGWGKKARTTDELMQIAAVGGGLVLDASGTDVNHLEQLAVLCGGRGSTLYLKNCGGIETTNLIWISSVGRGHVVIEF